MAKETQFDGKVARTLLVLMGVTAVIVGLLMKTDPLPENCAFLALPLAIAFFTVGIVLLLVGVLSSKSTVIRWADSTGNHEVMIVFLMLAYGIAAIIPDKK